MKSICFKNLNNLALFKFITIINEKMNNENVLTFIVVSLLIMSLILGIKIYDEYESKNK